MMTMMIQYHGTSCLELSVSSYRKFCYHHQFHGTSDKMPRYRREYRAIAAVNFGATVAEV